VVAEGCGHYGLFSGSKWRTAIYPEIRAFIREHQVAPAATRAAGKALLAAVPATAPTSAD